VKLLIAEHLIEKYCRKCPSFGGVAERLGVYSLALVKCGSGGEEGDDNCEACTGTLTYLIRLGLPPAAILEIAEAVGRGVK